MMKNNIYYKENDLTCYVLSRIDEVCSEKFSTHIFTLANDDDIIGTVEMYYYEIMKDEKHVSILRSLYIVDKYRKNGYGRLLVNLVEKYSKELKFEEIMLFVEKDKWMKNWYDKLSYEKTEDKGDEEIWMKKEL
jgi:N-acetylglutamate synthase-like GNAT family acetyltransferase